MTKQELIKLYDEGFSDRKNQKPRKLLPADFYQFVYDEGYNRSELLYIRNDEELLYKTFVDYYQHIKKSKKDYQPGFYKINLTFWQIIELIFVYLVWVTHESNTKKSWYEVKKGMEKHHHNFCNPVVIDGHRFLKCDHIGCEFVDPVDLK